MPRRHTANTHPDQTSFAALLNSSHASTVQETPTAFSVSPALPTFAEYVPVFTVKLVKTGSIALRDRLKITCPRDVANLLYKHFEGADRECFVTVFLDTKSQVIGISTISVGDLSSCLVHPREVFKLAILCNAASIILAHNHPSGDPAPSPDDVAVTRRLSEAGEAIGIEVLDHIVIGDIARWVSLKEKGLMTSGSYGASQIEDRCTEKSSFTLSP